MKEIERIADQLKRSFAGKAWHGPAVQELLQGVSAADANARPIANVHNIWELTLHIGAWENAAVRRLSGDRAELRDDEDWSTVQGRDEEAWAQVKKNLDAGHEMLVQAITKLDESRLDEPILEGMTSVYGTLHGVIQHNLYHAGQIAILKKALAEKRS